jgi:hypothetical protein
MSKTDMIIDVLTDRNHQLEKDNARLRKLLKEAVSLSEFSINKLSYEGCGVFGYRVTLNELKNKMEGL